jgi:O-antigen ligase
VILRVLPMGEKNVLFLFVLPVVGFFFLLMIIDVKIALILLLFTRAPLDYVLGLTRVDIQGQSIGVGGGINLFVLVLALVLVIKRPQALLENPISKRWIIYLVICAIAVLYAPVRGRGVRLFLNLLSYYGMLTIPYVLINRFEDKKFWLKVLLFSTILPVFFANLDLFRGAPNYQDAGMRIQGTFPHPNILAFYLVFVITLVFYVLQGDMFSLNKAGKAFLRIYILNLFILLMATKTRNAWIACWGLFFLYGLLKERRYLFYSLTASVLALFISPIRERVFNVIGSVDLEDVESLNSFTWRLRLWKASLLSIKETFFFGNGLASFEFVVERLPGWDVRAGAHNTYLEVLLETGLLGIAAYVGIYFKLLKIFYTKMRETVANLSTEYILLFCYAGSYVVVCFGDNMLYYLSFNWYFWFFMGVMTRSAQLGI